MSHLDLPAAPAATSQPPSPSRGPGLSQRAATILVCGFLTVLLGAVMSLLPAPYAIYGPGPVTNVLGQVNGKQLISITGHQTYPAQGPLDMTTVEVYGGPGRRLSLLQVVQAWISRSQAVLPVDQVFPPGQSAQEIKSENAAEMSGSQQSATAVGLREAGLAVPETVRVSQVSPDAPAAQVLRAGDVITGVNGTPTVDSAAVRDLISALPAGAELSVQVRRDGKALNLRTTTTTAQGRTLLGVGLDPAFRFPVDVQFVTRDVGGPSAGMMFALGIYDLLTPGELTGGESVAGTGTIDSAGTVGPIGGIAQKMVGARAAGARWFIAPAANCTEVVENVPDGLQVVRSSSLHQSRLAVQAIAAGHGSTLATCAG